MGAPCELRRDGRRLVLRDAGPVPPPRDRHRRGPDRRVVHQPAARILPSAGAKAETMSVARLGLLLASLTLLVPSTAAAQRVGAALYPDTVRVGDVFRDRKSVV